MQSIDFAVNDLITTNAQRTGARTQQELQAKEFILRPDEKEFALFLSSVRGLIHSENEMRPHNPFSWIPTTGHFENDMRCLCYKIKDEEKLLLLTQALNVLGQKWNWIDYLLIAIKATIRATMRQRINNHYAFTLYKLKRPYSLVNDITDGSLGRAISDLIKSQARVSMK